jgi:tRNA-dihydrouridine synthase A
MMDFTDRHCRYFHRRLSRRARLYTEMVTTGALIHGPRDRLLGFDDSEHPVALQLGGCDPAELAQCARMAEQRGYDEVNLNCGCPSERVQRGAFGACLMAEPRLVADCVRAMCDAVSIPVTVKHRIGLDRDESYDFVRDFVGELARAGCGVFIVHARNAWLKGLSPKENREIPPLRYEVVQALKRDFPELRFVLNGGLRTHDQAMSAMQGLDGAMVGRQACEDPWFLAQVDQLYFGDPAAVADRVTAASGMQGYIESAVAAGAPVRAVVRHMLGLFNGLAGARHWRRLLSDSGALSEHGTNVVNIALERCGFVHGASELPQR